ncbi:MAG: penicillin acylase family protein, partial [Myxococcota bacterium]
MRHAHLIPFLILLLASCGDDDGGPDDGGTEVGPDAADVSTEPSLEVGPDAPIEEGLRIEGLSAGVSAHFDAAGVLSLDCATNEDCVAALGYFHARDRFVQMDFRRRVTSGRLSGILSSFAADLAEPVDVSNRALYSTRSGMPLEDTVLEAATEEVRGVLEAYASGVNAWIADVQAGRNGAIFPREFENGLLFDYSAERIPAWRPEDSVSTVLALIDSLTNDSDAEIRRGVARAEFIERFGAAEGEQRFRDLFDVSTEVEAPILDGFGEMASRTPDVMQCAPRGNPALPVGTGATLLAENDAAFGLFGERFLGQAGGLGGFGSNNWVVAPELSASGNALFANDPHLGMSNPSTWYVAHMDASTNGSGDLHVAGMTFAGLPFVIIGQNENIAWGATTTNFDMTDVYVEEVSDDGTTVTFRGEQVPIITRTFAVDRADGTSNEFELAFVPHHGPVLQAESEDGPMLSLRWTGNDTTTDINFLTSLSRASTVEEAQTALRQITTIGQNWVIADTAGNIGWFPYNRVPERPWATSYDPASGTEAIPWLPLDGRGDFEWESFY